MSIFFSPDEPKVVDIHSGRVTRLRNSEHTFSREKSNTLKLRKTKINVIPETTELRVVRADYNKFCQKFTEYNVMNGPSVTGKKMSDIYLHFKSAFDSILLHAQQYFNSSNGTRRVGRYSPIIQFSCSLLKEWSSLVVSMNNLAECSILPHVQQIQYNFDELNSTVSTIANSLVKRTYYRDSVFAASNMIKSEISRVYNLIYKTLMQEPDEGLDTAVLCRMKGEMVTLSRKINENFIGLLPSNISCTPENTRLKGVLKSSCGDIVALLEAAYYFRDRTNNLLAYLHRLDISIRDLLDSLGVKYRLDVSPKVDPTYQISDNEYDEYETEEITSRSIPKSRLENENESFFVEIPEGKKTKYPNFKRRSFTSMNAASMNPYKSSVAKNIPRVAGLSMSLQPQRAQTARVRTSMDRTTKLLPTPNALSKSPTLDNIEKTVQAEQKSDSVDEQKCDITGKPKSDTSEGKDIENFLTEMSSVLNVNLDEKADRGARMAAVEKAIKERLGDTSARRSNDHCDHNLSTNEWRYERKSGPTSPKASPRHK